MTVALKAGKNGSHMVAVSRSAYYVRRRSVPSARAQANMSVLAEIRAIPVEHEARYGSPRMRDELGDRGHQVGKHRAARLMREKRRLDARSTPIPHTSDSRHKLPIALNLLGQRFTATAPNQAWAGDITDIWTAEGLAVSALERTLTCRKPPPGLTHHTDRGCQSASHDYCGLLDQHAVRCNMSAASYDNAVAESFFATLKKELVHGCAFERAPKRTTPSASTSRTTTTRNGGTQPPATNRRSTSSWRMLPS